MFLVGKKYRHIAVEWKVWRQFKAFKSIMQYLCEKGTTITSTKAINFMIKASMKEIEARLEAHIFSKGLDHASTRENEKHNSTSEMVV